MTGAEAGTVNRVVVTDANVLINLFHIGRLDLLGKLAGFEFVVPPEVVEEVSEPRQAAALAEVLAKGFVRREPLTLIPALMLYAELVRIMGRGEAACLSLALANGWMVASDEKGVFRREVLARIGARRLLNTPGILLLAIRRGVLSVAEADAALPLLAEHRFRVRFNSFRELLGEAAE